MMDQSLPGTVTASELPVETSAAEPLVEASVAEPLVGVPVRVGTPYTLGEVSEARILALAAAAGGGAADPVERAVRTSLAADYPRQQVPDVAQQDLDLATPERRFTVARVRQWPVGEAAPTEQVVLSGDLDAIESQVHLRGERKRLLNRNANSAIRRGWRPLGVAVAPVYPGGAMGPFRMLGFVPVGLQGSVTKLTDSSATPVDFARIPVWPFALRVQHWWNLALIVILSATGFYIMDPFFGPQSFTGAETGFLMGYVRLIHFIAAALWIILGLTRILLAFTSTNRFVRWPTFWPLKSRADLHNLVRVIKHYLFIGHDEPIYLGHNPLQQLAYSAVYLLAALQVFTGLMLFGLFRPGNWFFNIISIPVGWVGIPMIRLIHTLIMLALWIFTLVHVYLVFRIEALEHHGTLSAMINGSVNVPRGTQPVDAPMVE